MKRIFIIGAVFASLLVTGSIIVNGVLAQKRVTKVVTDSPPSNAPTAGFTPGNLVVIQVGDGVAAPTNSANQVALVEYAPAGGSPVQTISIPSGTTSPRLTVTGNSTSEAHLVRSSDGRYLTLTGYDVAAGTATGFAVAGTPRTIARVDASGTVDLTTALTDGSTGAVRSAASTNGTDIWQTNSVVGLRYKAFGSSGTSTQITSAPTNTRVVKVFNNQLYMTSGSATFTCINTVGTGVPTATGNTTTSLPGMVCSSRSPYSFSISPSGTTLYLADDGAFGSNGGIQKWTLSAGTWTNTYTLLNTGTATTAVRGLTVDWSGPNPIVYATTTATTANTLISVTDTGSASTATTVATAPANTYFRGVDFAPVSHIQHVLDFNGDGKTDYSVVRNFTPGDPNGPLMWYNCYSGVTEPNCYQFVSLGNASDKLVPADYDGDGKTDIAVWHPGDTSVAGFYILQSTTNTVRYDNFGQTGDDPSVVADYTGDHSADPAVYRPGVNPGDQSYFFYRASSGPNTGSVAYEPWGQNADVPVPGDYDGDGKADFMIRRGDVTGHLTFWLRTNGTNNVSVQFFGLAADYSVPGDYDGDGKTDLAVARDSGGNLNWYYRSSITGNTIWLGPFGSNLSDYIVQGDYDGDGKTDIAVWRPTVDASPSIFYVMGSKSGFMVFPWGTASSFDKPVGHYNLHY